MANNNVNGILMYYISANVFPMYKNNDEGHGIEHINDVINRSFELSENLCMKLNPNIIYTVASYHDVGIWMGRKNHEINSGKIMWEDDGLRFFFNDNERVIIKEAIEDHRASNKSVPRSIYGKIVSSADRSVSVNDIIVRAYEGIKKHGVLINGEVASDLTHEETVDLVYEHLIDKYGKNGYAKNYIIDKKYIDFLKELNEIINDRHLYEEKCKLLLNRDIMTQEKYDKMKQEANKAETEILSLLPVLKELSEKLEKVKKFDIVASSKLKKMIDDAITTSYKSENFIEWAKKDIEQVELMKIYDPKRAKEITNSFLLSFPAYEKDENGKAVLKREIL